jgi:predicted CoA-binding protein
MKKTLVLGASSNPDRYSYKAIQSLIGKGMEVIAFGLKPGMVSGVSILTDFPDRIADLDTVTLYINPQRQAAIYSAVLSLKPKRIVFNPGTENDEFSTMAVKAGIEVMEACTLVMLATGQY